MFDIFDNILPSFVVSNEIHWVYFRKLSATKVFLSFYTILQK